MLAGIPVYFAPCVLESSGFIFSFCSFICSILVFCSLISSAVLVCPIRSLTSLNAETAFLLPGSAAISISDLIIFSDISPVIIPSAIFLKSAFLRLATPEALPPFFAISRCSSAVRSPNGIKLSCPFATHLTFPSVYIRQQKRRLSPSYSKFILIRPDSNDIVLILVYPIRYIPIKYYLFRF